MPINGCIYVTANYGNESNLYTVKEYQDFVFRFEFCFVRPGVNNGVGIRTPMGVDAAYYGMCESQILDHDDPIYAGLHEYQVHGSVYGVNPGMFNKTGHIGFLGHGAGVKFRNVRVLDLTAKKQAKKGKARR